MIKKVITFFVLIIGFLFFSYSYSVEDTNGIVSNIFQESINTNFEPIDERVEDFLTNLNSSKNYCFGPEKQMDFTECVDYVEKVFSINSDQFVMGEEGYAKACEKSLAETIEKSPDKAIAAVDSKTILQVNGTGKSCTELYKFKLDIFKSVAYDILEKNKYAILRDEHKKYTKTNRTKFDELLEFIRVNLGNIERLRKKWPSKTKK